MWREAASSENEIWKKCVEEHDQNLTLNFSSVSVEKQQQ